MGFNSHSSMLQWRRKDDYRNENAPRATVKGHPHEFATRDRHAREDVFAQYDHYLSHYWEYRTVSVEVFDSVGRAADGERRAPGMGRRGRCGAPPGNMPRPVRGAQGRRQLLLGVKCACGVA